jgi:hypothetical protein
MNTKRIIIIAFLLSIFLIYPTFVHGEEQKPCETSDRVQKELNAMETSYPN